MNWEALSSISAAVGAVGVVVSLAYLAYQIHQNTKATRAAIAHEAVSAAREFNRSFMEDYELAEVYVKGWEEPDRLNDKEKQQFLHVAFNMFKLAEDLHYQYVTGILEEDVWKGWERLFATYMQSPGGNTYWDQRRQVFSSTFQNYRDALPPAVVPRHAAMLDTDSRRSSLDVKGVDLDISREDIVSTVRESREL